MTVGKRGGISVVGINGTNGRFYSRLCEEAGHCRLGKSFFCASLE